MREFQLQELMRRLLILFILILIATAYLSCGKGDVVAETFASDHLSTLDWEPNLDQAIQQLETILAETDQQQQMTVTEVSPEQIDQLQETTVMHAEADAKPKG